MQNRIILAIDPGFDRVGVAVLRDEGGEHTLLHSECIETKPKDVREKRLLAIGTRLREVIVEWEPVELAIEKLFFNQNTSTALGVAEARGVIIFTAIDAGLPMYEYSPQEIKIAVTGYGKADKSQVALMTRKLIEFTKTDKKMLDDEMDAVALGITHLASRRPI